VTTPSEQQWLEQARALVLRSDFDQAESLLNSALAGCPSSFELRRLLAGVHRKRGRHAEAEALLRGLLDEQPQDAGCAFGLAELLIEQVRTQAAGQVLRTLFESGERDADLAIRAIEWLDEADRKTDAAAIAELAIAAAPADPRLHAHAGTLQLELGAFDRAREHYLFALEHSPQACEWHVPQGLASTQRYDDPGHADFERFNSCLGRADLGDRARSTLLFALGKAHDDLGRYDSAAGFFRQANTLAHALTAWSRKDWRRLVQARLGAKPNASRGAPVEGVAPVFIVGMPPSRTTLLAQLLSRHSGVCNRGEMPWIARLSGQADLSGQATAEALTRGAAFYMRHARRDDAPDATWFIDKQPLNFRYVDLMLAMFPNAKVVHCARNPRDTALSLWMQSFREDVHGYAYDFEDIAVVMHDCERLMAHWQRLFPHAVRAVRYEDLVAAPDTVLSGLVDWIGLPGAHSPRAEPSSISTASAWQARQPIYPSSLQRWRAYADHVPELLKFPAVQVGSGGPVQRRGNSM
jgi:tetratricopeptide (TPR) repeat protein